jgi:hypothetical protein
MPITSRQEFIDYTMRSLGAPVIQVNVDPQQIEDRLDEAIKYMQERHFDFNQRALYLYQVEQKDIAQRYFDTSEFGPALGAQGITHSNGSTGFWPIADDILSITKVYMPSGQVGDYMFDLRYQLTLFDFFGLYFNQSGYPMGPMASYMESMSYIKLINDVFNYPMAYTFQKTTNRLFLDYELQGSNYSGLIAGNYLLVEAYVKINTDDYPKVWEDRLFQRYFAAILKKQWAQNLMKYSGMPLPGGAQLNAPAIMQEGMREAQEIEMQLLKNYEFPPDPLIG